MVGASLKHVTIQAEGRREDIVTKLQSIPIIFGITGHRDLRSEDIVPLVEKITKLLVSYQSAYPNTGLIILSALAEGADMLVAGVAKKLGVVLHIMLPYEEKAYLESFEEDESKKEFEILKDYASKCETLLCDHADETGSCYQRLGKYIADNSNILLALWDGVNTGKQGGTSAVVHYMRTGFEANRFDGHDGNALFIIMTPRKSNPDVQTDFEVKMECLSTYVKGAEFEKMLMQIDTLNKEINWKVKELKDAPVLKTFMRYFDAVADANQRKYKVLLKIILGLTVFAIASLEIMHVLHLDHFTAGYGFGLLAAFGVYWYFMKKGKVQDDFVYSRGFAESLRIQDAWNRAGIQKSVAKYYLTNQHHKFTWIRVVLKNLYYLDNKLSDLNSVEPWIDGQIDYFNEAVAVRDSKLIQLELLEKFFYKTGLLALVIMFLVYILESSHIIGHGALWLNWHYLVLVSSLLLLIAAFLGEKYMKIEGYEEEIYRFNAMLSNFKDAKNSLKDTEQGSEEHKKIVFDLGMKALDENSKWVVLHDSMRAKPSLDK